MSANTFIPLRSILLEIPTSVRLSPLAVSHQEITRATFHRLFAEVNQNRGMIRGNQTLFLFPVLPINFDMLNVFLNETGHQ